MTLSEEIKQQIVKLKKLYPEARSALMPALHLIQEKNGFISEEDTQELAVDFELSVMQVKELVSFYTMYKDKPVGKYHIRLCRSLMCELEKSKKVCEYLQTRLNTAENESTSDGLWSYELVECLGACGEAPALMINDVLYTKMDNEKLAQLMDKIEAERPELRLTNHQNEERGEIGA